MKQKPYNVKDFHINDMFRRLFDTNFNLQPEVVSTVPTTTTLNVGEAVIYNDGSGTIRLYRNIEGTLVYWTATVA